MKNNYKTRLETFCIECEMDEARLVNQQKFAKDLRELLADKERLDCLERLGEKGTDVFIDRDHPMYAIRIWPKIGPGPQYDGDSLRAAIDSWRKEENEKSQKSS